MGDDTNMLPLIEETLELSRDTNTRLTGLEVQVRSMADTVQKHDASLYHADEGGLIGRLVRVEDRLKADIKSVADKAAAELKSVADAAAANSKRIEDRVALIWALGGIAGGVVISWLLGQFLGLIQ